MVQNKISPCFFTIHNDENAYQVSYEITNLCNLKCQHCCNKSTSTEYQGLSKDTIFSLIDELKSINVNSIYMSGGEPTLYPHFSDIVTYIHKNSIDLALATNATEINNVLPTLTTFNETREGIFISIDGLEDTHDKLRGKTGAFRNTVNSIKVLLINNIPVRISTVIWKENLNELEDLILFIQKIGVYKLHFSMLFNTGRAADNNIGIPEEQYATVCDEVDRLAKKYSNNSFSISMRRNQPFSVGCDYCYGTEKILHINSKGYVFPCSWIAKTDLGKIYSFKWQPNNFKENLKELQKFQNLVRKRIELYGYSGCPAVAYEKTKDMYGEDPLNKYLNEK
jgi:MoaA/NifB/PqqE/SkfB family radical SAM enzyme